MMKSSLLGIPFIHHVTSAESRKSNSDLLLEILDRIGGKFDFLFAAQFLQKALGLHLCKMLFQVALFSVQAFQLPNLQRCGNGGNRIRKGLI